MRRRYNLEKVVELKSRDSCFSLSPLMTFSKRVSKGESFITSKNGNFSFFMIPLFILMIVKNFLLFQSTIMQMDNSKNTAKVIVGSKTSLSLSKVKNIVVNCKRKVTMSRVIFVKCQK